MYTIHCTLYIVQCVQKDAGVLSCELMNLITHKCLKLHILKVDFLAQSKIQFGQFWVKKHTHQKCPQNDYISKKKNSQNLFIKGVTNKNKAAQTNKLCKAQPIQRNHLWSLYDLLMMYQCTVWKTIKEIELRICQPFRRLFYFSLSFIPFLIFNRLILQNVIISLHRVRICGHSFCLGVMANFVFLIWSYFLNKKARPCWGTLSKQISIFCFQY